jgi:ABC-2 type transport system ATP-binding protein
MPKETMIELKGLAKHFGPIKAVDGIDLTVAKGECFGLLGRNGAGKSTTIKMLVGLLQPSAGWAKVAGFDLARQSAQVRANIGYVPQSLSVDGVLTGWQNLEIFGQLHCLPRSLLQRRIPETLAMLDLEDAAHRPVATYSGGMVRRLEIGQSILHRPAVILLDEPTVGLDPVSRRIMWDHIRRLQQKEKITLLLTTHYMDEAQELCGRIAIMNKGRIAGLGTTAQLGRKAGMPGADLDKIFAHYSGHQEADSGSLKDVQRSRRLARRLG